MAAGLTAHADTTAKVVGDLVTSVGEIFICTVAGTTGTGEEPAGAQPSQIDGTVTWDFVGVGANIDLGFCGVTPAGGVPYNSAWV
jgi:hypothetical protein